MPNKLLFCQNADTPVIQTWDRRLHELIEFRVEDSYTAPGLVLPPPEIKILEAIKEPAKRLLNTDMIWN